MDGNADLPRPDRPPPRPGGMRPPMRGPGGRSLTESPIASTLVLFALPLMGGNLLQSLNASVNQFWVSHLLGETAITAIGNANSVMFMMQSAIMGAIMAANILIAQQVGAGDLTMVKRIMGTAVTFFFVVAMTLSLSGGFLAPHILTSMHTPPAAKADAIIYLRVVFAAMPFMYFFQFLQMAQRGVGDSRTPFYFMGLAVVLDMILNPLLIQGIAPFPKLGVAGSATSTLIGQGVSLFLLVVLLYIRRSVLMLRGRDLRYLWPSMELLRPLVVRGIPMSLQMFIMSATGNMMITFVNGYGAVTSAAYVGAMQVWNYIQMPGFAVGMAVSSMAGQNVGAGQWARVDRIAIVGLGLSVAVTGTAALIIYALGPIPLYVFLREGSPAVPIALHIDRTVLWAFVIFNATFVLTGVVRSTGAVWPPLGILFFSMVCVRAPFAHFLIPIMGPEAIWWAFPVGTVTSSVLTGLYFRYGGWKKVRMLHQPIAAEPDPAGEPVGEPVDPKTSVGGEILA